MSAKPKRKPKGSTRSSVSGKYVSPEGADPATTVRESRDEYGAKFVASVSGVYPDDEHGSVVEFEIREGVTFTIPAGDCPSDLTADEKVEWRGRRIA